MRSMMRHRALGAEVGSSPSILDWKLNYICNNLAPGTVEGLAMIENILENIARKTKKDPLEIRMTNLAAGNEMTKLLPDFAQSVGKFYVKVLNILLR